MKKFPIILFILLSLALPSSNILGFGKNNVITKDFDYNICTTGHFKIYFYEDGRDILPFVIEVLEKTYSDVTKKFGLDFQEKIPYFLYIGHNDFEQSNIVSIGEGTGGVTEAYKNRFTVPYMGSKAWFVEVIKHEFTHECEFNVLFGGGWRSVRLMKSIFYPNWLLEGLAVYSENNFTVNDQDILIRDAAILPKGAEAYREDNLVRLDYLHNYSHLKPHEIELAYNESGMLVGYLTEEYGWDKVKAILRLYRDRFDSGTVLKETIGVTDLFEIDRKFREWVKEKYTLALSTGMAEPEKYGRKITKSDIYSVYNSNPRFLPGDKKIVYLTDINGYYEILEQDMDSGGIKSLINNKSFDEIDNLGGSLSLTADGKSLVFTGEKNKVDYIFIYDLNKEKFTRLDMPVKIIRSTVVSPDGRKIYFCGMERCSTYLYCIDSDGKNLVKLTDGQNYVSDLAVSPDGKLLVFAQEMETEGEALTYKRDSMLYNIEKSSITKLPDFPKGKAQPSFSPDSKNMLFVSNNDIYMMDMETKECRQLTKIMCANFNPVFSGDGKKILFCSFRNGDKHIYIGDAANFDSIPAVEKPETSQASSSETAKSDENISTGTAVSKGDVQKAISGAKPYRLDYSTDMFIPFFMYSSIEGMYLMMYWQLSDITGNHAVTLAAEYMSNVNYLDYQVVYFYRKYRAQLFVNFTRANKYADVGNGLYIPRRVDMAGCIYPLSKFNRVEFALGRKEEQYSFEDYKFREYLGEGSFIGSKIPKEHFVLANFLRDTTTGKYLEVTSGSRFGIMTQFGLNAFGTDSSYQNITFHFHDFITLGREQTIAARVVAGASMDRDRGVYDLIGYDRIRMSPDNIRNRFGTNVILTNLEWRFPVVNDLNYHMWYMFPDFFFKSLYGILFFDAGLTWIDNEKRNSLFNNYLASEDLYYGITGTGTEPRIADALYSYGIGFRFNTFVLESSLLKMNFNWGYSPLNKKTGYYVVFGYVF